MLCGKDPIRSFRKTVLFFRNTVPELPVSDCCRALVNQAPRYHAKPSFYLMASMSAALLHARYTMKNTIGDADHIINWIFLLLIINLLHIPVTPTLLSISHFYLLYSMAYFPAKREYREKYHAQKILQNAR